MIGITEIIIILALLALLALILAPIYYFWQASKLKEKEAEMMDDQPDSKQSAGEDEADSG